MALKKITGGGGWRKRNPDYNKGCCVNLWIDTLHIYNGMEKQYWIKQDLVKFSRDNLIQNIRLVHIIDQKKEFNILSYKDERFFFVFEKAEW